MTRLAEETHTVDWTDDEIIEYADKYADSGPVFYIPLRLAVHPGQPDIAVITRHFSRTTVKRTHGYEIKQRWTTAVETLE